MRQIELNRNWQFRYGPGGETPPGTPTENDSWQTVDLPHDASINLTRRENVVGGGSNAYFPGAVCWYEKELDIPEDWMDKTVLLELEGVYQNASVYLNRHLLARHPYGYSTFHCTLSPWLTSGKNLLRIEANNGGLPNTRWYTGSGLYRPVRLLLGSPVHLVPRAFFVTTLSASDGLAAIRAVMLAQNHSEDEVCADLRLSVLDGARILASQLTPVTIPASGKARTTLALTIPDVVPWSPETPALYTVQAELLHNGQVVDTQTIRYGFRTIAFHAEHGFQLNGSTRKMKGGCVHHDCGILGAAAHPRAEERKVALLKANGFDAVRCAHNPPSVTFLNACDEQGLLVINEAFDCWRHGKNAGDYNLWFEDWWERDLAAMVRRDRNHPSIVMWSTGNEIIERDGRSGAALLASRMADMIRTIDPTRPVTNALCDLWEDNQPNDTPEDIMNRWDALTGGFAAPLDVVGYNYLLHRYERDVTQYPGRVICGTETFAKDAFDYWEATVRLPHVIGDFVWTALDYLGEAGIGHENEGDKASDLKPYPWHHANCGDIDLCGFKRPQSFYRDCVWGIAKTPYLAVHAPTRFGKQHTLSPWGWPDVQACWHWPGQEGKPCQVDVYSMAEEVVLLLNDVEVGRKPAGKAHRHLASFELAYTPGRLVAVACKAGEPLSQTVLETAGPPHALRLTPDRTQLDRGHGDLTHVQVEVLDAQGRFVPDALQELHFTVHGAGRLLAVGNADPASEEAYVGNVRGTWRGRALAVVQAQVQANEQSQSNVQHLADDHAPECNDVPGTRTLMLTVTGEGLRPATLALTVSTQAEHIRI